MSSTWERILAWIVTVPILYLISFKYLGFDRHRKCPDMTGHVRTWLGMTGNDLPWPDMTCHDRTWPAMICHDRTWPAIICHDRTWPAMICHDRKWPTLTGHDRPWPDMADHDRTWPTMTGNDRTWPIGTLCTVRDGTKRPGKKLFYFSFFRKNKKLEFVSGQNKALLQVTQNKYIKNQLSVKEITVRQFRSSS
jgi:hypothetical protein